MSPAPAPPPPPLRHGDIPIAVLVDYDGTVALTDVSDTIMASHVQADWAAQAAAYDAGHLGSRDLMIWEIGLIRTDPERLQATAAAQPHDPDFAAFVRRARSAGIVVEVVSDGFGFFIRPALERLGVGELPIVTASTTFEAGVARIEFPNGNPDCLVCGTCKRNRVLAHQAAGRSVVFIGDGESDRYAAGYSDVVFAKGSLVAICEREGWPHHPWRDFAELDGWLAATVARVQADPAWPAPPRRRPFFCGPEVWGPGRHNPPVAGEVPGT